RLAAAGRSASRRRRSSRARSAWRSGSPSLLRLGEGAERLFQALLLGPVGRPVTTPQRVLGACPDLQSPLTELARARGAAARRAPSRLRGRGGGRRRCCAPAEDPRERLLERRLHRDLVAVGDDHAAELGW